MRSTSSCTSATTSTRTPARRARARTIRPTRRSPWTTTAAASPRCAPIRTLRHCTCAIRWWRSGTTTTSATTRGATAPSTTTRHAHGPWPERVAAAAAGPPGVAAATAARPDRSAGHVALAGRSATSPSSSCSTRGSSGATARPATTEAPPLDDPARSLLGDEQRAWLRERLLDVTRPWAIVASGVVVNELDLPWPRALRR